ncbi:MAG TPA: chromate efflux transporter [Acidiferrobacterales bacterium]|nr:chromate efflux transporter [Acidiferrobacterales bacterium]
MSERISLWSLFATFLKIGSTAFGGFMALIAVVQNEVVERKRWLQPEDMLDGISLATILPGPVAVNVVAYVGYRLRGALGALVSVVGVTLTAFVLMLGLSVAYFEWGSFPAVGRVFQGFLPAVAAIIVLAAWNMGRKAVRGTRELALAALAAALLFGVGGFWVTLVIIAGSGAAGIFLFRRRQPTPAAAAPGPRCTTRASLLSVTPLLPLALAAPLFHLDLAIVAKLLVTFGGMSMLLFGGGYVFIPLIQEVVVGTHHWLSVKEFLDGIAMSQIMPGPIVLSATFVGYKVAGFAGALAATIGIFGPPALTMLAASYFLEHIKRSALIKAALAGIRPAVVGMIATAAFTVGLTAPQHWVSLLIFVSALIALARLRVPVVWVIPAAGLTGLLLF